MNLRHFIRITATLGVAALIAGCGESAPPGAAKKNVSYLEIDAPQGHDAFLMPIPRYLQAFSGYMNRISV